MMVYVALAVNITAVILCSAALLKGIINDGGIIPVIILSFLIAVNIVCVIFNIGRI